MSVYLLLLEDPINVQLDIQLWLREILSWNQHLFESLNRFLKNFRVKIVFKTFNFKSQIDNTLFISSFKVIFLSKLFLILQQQMFFSHFNRVLARPNNILSSKNVFYDKINSTKQRTGEVYFFRVIHVSFQQMILLLRKKCRLF